MALVVVGGQTRGVGKTSVMCGLISALREWEWTAVKISSHKHSEGTEVCEEFDPEGGTDSSRYLKAGAMRSFFLSVPSGQFVEAVDVFSRLLRDLPHVMVESTSILHLVTPAVALAVIDPNNADTKDSLLALADRFDAVVLPAGTEAPVMLARARRFEIRLPEYCSEALVDFVAGRLVAGRQRMSSYHFR